MNFPAGVLLPPLYDPTIDAAPNYGNTGTTIGHELTHGFDDEGRQFDEHGNLDNWWTPDDEREFKRRATLIVRQYNDYVAVGDLHVNGLATEGENIADLGGLQLGWDAFTKTSEYKRGESIGKTKLHQDASICLVELCHVADEVCGQEKAGSRLGDAIVDVIGKCQAL